MMKKTQFVILGLLQEENLSGYEIKRIIDIRMSYFWQESYGQIYPELNRLCKEGYVEITKEELGEKSKREKVKYQITVKGREFLKQWMLRENEKDTSRSEFLLKMYLATEDNQEEMQQHLMKFRQESELKLQLFQLFYQELSKLQHLHGNHGQILKVLDLGMRQARTYIEWCHDVEIN